MIEVVLDGPGKNALGSAVMSAALDALRAAKGQPVLLRGAGDAFSAGLNLKEIAALEPAGMERFLDLLDRLVVAIYEHDAPTVAAINGHAIAGGCVLSLACDLRVMTSDTAARIGLNEVPLGLVFPPRVLLLAKRRLAPPQLDRVILEGALVDPSRALELGLVHEVAHDPVAAGRTLLERLAASPREAYLEAKRALDGGALLVTEEQARHYRERVLPGWSSPELKQRVAAVLAKKR